MIKRAIGSNAGAMLVTLLLASLPGCGLGYVGIPPGETEDAGGADGPMTNVLTRPDGGTRPMPDGSTLPPTPDSGSVDAPLGHPESGPTDASPGKPDAQAPADTGPTADAADDTSASEDADDSGGLDAGGGLCLGYAPPDVIADCTACFGDGCQPNGCYGGYWCNTETGKCHELPPIECGDE
jgi:hypothetical protein